MLLGLGVFWYGRGRTRWWRRLWQWMDGGEDMERRPADVDGEMDWIQFRVESTQVEEEQAADELIAATVHDLKTPLLGIRQLSEVLRDQESLSEDGRRKLELIHASSMEAMSQVDELLNAVAGEASPLGEQAPVDVRELAEGIVDSLRPHAECKNQVLRCDVPQEACRVEANALRLREAASNLVSNALKYSPPSETIRVRVRSSEGDVRFSVSDNGPGINEEEQRRLFAPFEQLSPQPTGAEGGSGMGLYVTKQIADLHGGDVEVDTVEGEGSTFTLVLPAALSSHSSSEDTGP